MRFEYAVRRCSSTTTFGGGDVFDGSDAKRWTMKRRNGEMAKWRNGGTVDGGMAKMAKMKNRQPGTNGIDDTTAALLDHARSPFSFCWTYSYILALGRSVVRGSGKAKVSKNSAIRAASPLHRDCGGRRAARVAGSRLTNARSLETVGVVSNFVLRTYGLLCTDRLQSS